MVLLTEELLAQRLCERRDCNAKIKEWLKQIYPDPPTKKALNRRLRKVKNKQFKTVPDAGVIVYLQGELKRRSERLKKKVPPPRRSKRLMSQLEVPDQDDDLETLPVRE